MATRIVVHSSSSELLDAIERQPNADSVRTNHALGFVFARSLLPATSRELARAGDPGKPDEHAEVLVTAWRGNALALIFTKLVSAKCKLVSPVHPSSLSSVGLPLVPPLVAQLLDLAPFSARGGPALLRSLCGPGILVDAFLALWPHPRRPSTSRTFIAASVKCAPPPAVMPAGHSLSRVRDVEELSIADLEAVAQLLDALEAEGAGPAAAASTPEAAREPRPLPPPDVLLASTRTALRRGPTWLYRAHGTPVGLVEVGRPTRRTCALRKVVVAASHRGQGVAQRMVGEVVRACLLAGVDGGGRKDEVGLSVDPGNEPARRTYARVGFDEVEGLWSEVDLEGIEPGHRG